MSYPLRLPEALDAAARQRCASIGISLNALVCVALDAYLRGGAAGEPVAVQQPRAVVALASPKGRAETLDELHARARAVGQDPEHAEYLDPEDFVLLTQGQDPTDDELDGWIETGVLPAHMQPPARPKKPASAKRKTEKKGG